MDVESALYPRGDPFETSDPVFGVKESLIVDLGEVDDEIAAKYDVNKGTALLKYDFVLATKGEAGAMREKKAVEAMKKQNRKMKMLNGLPIPDLD
jgi:hypothetical protein